MKPFTESLRYEYPLTEDSWVVDVGAHIGNFSRDIAARYNCHVLGFEPVPEFWQSAIKNQSAKTTILPVGLGNAFRMADFRIKGDMTGEFAESDIVHMCPIIPIDALLRLPRIDLLKINCEGGEYSLLERIITIGMQKKIDNIQIQFHDVVQCAVRMREQIGRELSKTHHLTYDAPFVWENWQQNAVTTEKTSFFW